MQISCDINGSPFTREIRPDLMLADFLRDQGFLCVRQGCDTANCGLCTVWVDDVPMLSCSVLAARTDGKRITTIEGVTEEAAAFARFLADQGADQCGYCSPGLVMTVLAMKRELTDPTEDEIRHFLAGNLCRCTGYAGQTRAIANFLAAEGTGGATGNGPAEEVTP